MPKARQALALANLSDAYLLARRLEEALDHAERAVNLARRASVTAVLAATLNHLGNALLAQDGIRRPCASTAKVPR